MRPSCKIHASELITHARARHVCLLFIYIYGTMQDACGNNARTQGGVCDSCHRCAYMIAVEVCAHNTTPSCLAPSACTHDVCASAGVHPTNTLTRALILINGTLSQGGMSIQCEHKATSHIGKLCDKHSMKCKGKTSNGVSYCTGSPPATHPRIRNASIM